MRKVFEIKRGVALAGCSLAVALLAFIAGSPAASAAERSLGNVRIFTPVSIILKRFGDPTFISNGPNPALYSYSASVVTVSAPSGTGGVMGAAAPGGGGAGASAGADTGDPGETYTAGDITRYYYVRPGGLTYGFVLSPNGRVLSINLSGIHTDARTARGITLGSSYADMIEKYGYPERQLEIQPGVLTVSYMKRDHVAFRLVDNKVVTIIVSAAE